MRARAPSRRTSPSRTTPPACHLSLTLGAPAADGEDEAAELEADAGGGGDDDGDSLSALDKLLAAVAKHPEVMPKVRTLATDGKTSFAEHVTIRTLGEYCGLDEAAFKKTDPDQLRTIAAKLQGLLKSERLRPLLGDGPAPPWPVGRLLCEEGGGGGGGGTSAAAESGAAESGAESDDEPELIHFPPQFQDLAESLWSDTGMDGSCKVRSPLPPRACPPADRTAHRSATHTSHRSTTHAPDTTRLRRGSPPSSRWSSPSLPSSSSRRS